jgi:hypothetical protein
MCSLNFQLHSSQQISIYNCPLESSFVVAGSSGPVFDPVRQAELLSKLPGCRRECSATIAPRCRENGGGASWGAEDQLAHRWAFIKNSDQLRTGVRHDSCPLEVNLQGETIRELNSKVLRLSYWVQLSVSALRLSKRHDCWLVRYYEGK